MKLIEERKEKMKVGEGILKGTALNVKQYEEIIEYI